MKLMNDVFDGKSASHGSDSTLSTCHDLKPASTNFQCNKIFLNTNFTAFLFLANKKNAYGLRYSFELNVIRVHRFI